MRAEKIYKMTTFITVAIAAFAIVAFVTAIGISDTSAQERAEIEALL